MANLVTDTFTVAVDVNLTAHAPDTGTGWTEEEDTGIHTARIVAAQDYAKPNSTTASARVLYSAQPNPTEADVDVTMTIAVVPSDDDNTTFLFARFADVSNYIGYLTYRGAVATDKILFEKVAGVVGLIASADSGLTAGDILKLEIRGTTVTGYQNGSAVTGLTGTTSITAAGKAGVGWGNAYVATDDVQADLGIDTFALDEFAAAGGIAIPIIDRQFRARWG